MAAHPRGCKRLQPVEPHLGVSQLGNIQAGKCIFVHEMIYCSAPAKIGKERNVSRKISFRGGDAEKYYPMICA
ncbi:hypothetical protein SAMN05192568_1001426 [Methylobacterium pseudosasicola]|uniref:Uncharacterized protein n=1 Tax=Methylobacterium pseudosasicola TaxID=582667 RepID=A0A1I4FPF7_9HYPH|nr:hypothetical protein SAMN05192568_1001426 [Methylobacterium pseudosasicola]